MLQYPTKTTFYKLIKTKDSLGQMIETKGSSFTTGARVATLSFKEIISTGQAIDTTSLWVYVRRNPSTMSIATGDYVMCSQVSSYNYKVIGVDPKLSQRDEILFLVEKIED